MWTYVAWSLSLTIFVETVYALKSNPVRITNCSIDETRHYEVTVDDIESEVAVNCRNATFDMKPVVKCTQIRSIDLLSAQFCNLHTSLSSAYLRSVRILSFLNIITNDSFLISNLRIETLFIQKATTKELHLENLFLLKHLIIKSMNWTTIYWDPFRNLETLVTLFLPYNQLEYLEADTFDSLRQLLILNLNANKLKMLPDDLFKNTERLNYLYLESNRFVYLNATTFSKLKSLTRLSLAENTLRELPEGLISSNLELEYINLSHNPELSQIPDGFFTNARKLRFFYMQNCGLTTLAADVFRNCPFMKKIVLANNKLAYINSNTYFSPSVAYLDMSNNSLSSLPSNLFGSDHRLQYLNLSENHFFRIPTNTFSDMFSLVEVNMSYNEIQVVNTKDFDFLTNMQKLDLSNNRIDNLNSLGKAKSLLYINLSFNSIKQFPNISSASYNMNSIDLRNNDISYLTAADLSFTTKININLRYNQITTVDLNHSTQATVILHLAFNPFVCDCSLIKFVRFIQNESHYSFNSSLIVADLEELECNGPAKWKKKTLIHITSFHLCPIYSDCPTNCQCYQLQDFKTLVNCSSSGMTSFPSILSPNATIVHLEDNYITGLQTINANMWRNITHIYLDRNRIMAPKTWTPPTSLKLLSLRQNNFTYLPEGLQQFISSASAFVLDIRNNPWECSCEHLPFKRWFMKNLKKMVSPKNVLCSRMVNETVVLSSIQDTPEDAFCEPNFPSDNTTQTALAAVLVLMSLLIFATIIIYYRYCEIILAYVYVHIPILYCCSLSYVDRNKLYDAFVSYTGSDRDTVLSIVDELETKPPYFKLCIHERDWIAGYPITSQIETSVKNSKKTIVILTKDFLESFWCETEFQAAYLQSLEDRIDRIIIVIKGDLPERDRMPLDVQNLLASKTYLVWGERWFWEKLRYALPHYASSVRSENIEKIEEVEGMISNLMQRKSPASRKT